MLSFFLHLLFNIVSAYNELGGHRKFLRTETKSFLGDLHRYTLGLDEDTARSHRTYKALWVTLTFTHSDLGRLPGVRLVREYPDPYLSLTLHITNDCLTRRLDLTTGEPAIFQGLDAERTEHKLVAPLGKAFHTALLLPSKFCFLRL